MTARFSPFLSASVACLLMACTTPGTATNLNNVEAQIAKNGQYWQRVDATSAIWMQGPKAQQVLNRDIARCVTELGELERLGQIKSAFPAEKKDAEQTADNARKSLMEWDTPERDGMLLAEQGQYNDFETCMKSKGWERIMYVPHRVAERSASAYVDNHVDLQSRSTYEHAGQPTEVNGPYGNLNN